MSISINFTFCFVKRAGNRKKTKRYAAGQRVGMFGFPQFRNPFAVCTENINRGGVKRDGKI